MAKWYHTNREDISPIATFLGAAAVAWAALWQAQTARLRHENQSDADYSRRITETLLKASEQLGHEKIEVRLGGIYVLERIARDSEEAYWPVMEALTAFVREKSGLKTCTAQESESLFGVDSDERDESEMSVDVAAVVSVIRRRKVSSAEFEDPSNWSLDLAGCNLRRSNMAGAHLCHADFRRTCLEVSFLGGANIENGRLDRAKLREAFFILAKAINASFKYARLEGANFEKANLEGADFQGAHLERSVLHAANLRNANFEDARLDVSNLNMSILDGANFNRAFLRYVDFRGATGLTTDQLAVAHGDATTVLPENLARPKNWPVESHRSTILLKLYCHCSYDTLLALMNDFASDLSQSDGITVEAVSETFLEIWLHLSTIPTRFADQLLAAFKQLTIRADVTWVDVWAMDGEKVAISTDNINSENIKEQLIQLVSS